MHQNLTYYCFYIFQNPIIIIIIDSYSYKALNDTFILCPILISLKL